MFSIFQKNIDITFDDDVFGEEENLVEKFSKKLKEEGVKTGSMSAWQKHTQTNTAVTQGCDKKIGRFCNGFKYERFSFNIGSTWLLLE